MNSGSFTNNFNFKLFANKLYIYIYVCVCGGVGFYDISTLVGYLMLNSVLR